MPFVMHKIFTIFMLLSALLAAPLTAMAENFPHQASLKRQEVNVRSGPGTRYPILWVFRRQGWPITLLAAYENWYKIRDLEGEEGWVYRGLISQQKTAVVSAGAPLTLYRKAKAKKPLLRLAPQVVVYIDACGELMCRVIKDKHKGWVTKSRLRGLTVKNKS